MNVGDLVRILKRPIGLWEEIPITTIGKVLRVQEYECDTESIYIAPFYYQKECYEPFVWDGGDLCRHPDLPQFDVLIVVVSLLCSGTLVVRQLGGDGQYWSVKADTAVFVQPETWQIQPISAKKYRVINKKVTTNE
jgi:hypothetical protein